MWNFPEVNAKWEQRKEYKGLQLQSFLFFVVQLNQDTLFLSTSLAGKK